MVLFGWAVSMHVETVPNRNSRPDGLPVQSSKTLLAQLGTRSRNYCRLKADPQSPSFTQLTEPDPLRQRALNLLDLFPVTSTVCR
jgi:hypothetical protein